MKITHEQFEDIKLMIAEKEVNILKNKEDILIDYLYNSPNYRNMNKKVAMEKFEQLYGLSYEEMQEKFLDKSGSRL